MRGQPSPRGPPDRVYSRGIEDAFSTPLLLLVRGRRSEFAKDIDLLFCGISSRCFVDSSRGRVFGRLIALSSSPWAGSFHDDVPG